MNYDELMQSIFEKRKHFYLKYGIESNILFIGQDEYMVIVQDHPASRFQRLPEMDIMGLKITKVDEYNYCAVGITI